VWLWGKAILLPGRQGGLQQHVLLRRLIRVGRFVLGWVGLSTHTYLPGRGLVLWGLQHLRRHLCLQRRCWRARCLPFSL
jgi:hypothetical protein